MGKKHEEKPIHVICLRHGIREELCGYVEDEREAKRMVAERRGELTFYTIGRIKEVANVQEEQAGPEEAAKDVGAEDDPQ